MPAVSSVVEGRSGILSKRACARGRGGRHESLLEVGRSRTERRGQISERKLRKRRPWSRSSHELVAGRGLEPWEWVTGQWGP